MKNIRIYLKYFWLFWVWLFTGGFPEDMEERRYVCGFCGYSTTVTLPKSEESINFNCISCIDKFFRNQTFVGGMREEKGGGNDQ